MFSNLISPEAISGSLNCTIFNDHHSQLCSVANVFSNPPCSKSNIFDQENFILDCFYMDSNEALKFDQQNVD